jgi:hypothetical protein
MNACHLSFSLFDAHLAQNHRSSHWLRPELYAANPEYIQSLAEFVRGRPQQPLAAFLQELNAVIAYAVAAQLG